MSRVEGEPLSRRQVLNGFAGFGAGAILRVLPAPPGDLKVTDENRVHNNPVTSQEVSAAVTDMGANVLHAYFNPIVGFKKNGAIKDAQPNKRGEYYISLVAHFPEGSYYSRTHEHIKTGNVNLLLSSDQAKNFRYLLRNYSSMQNRSELSRRISDIAKGVLRISTNYSDELQNTTTYTITRTKHGWGLDGNNMLYATTSRRDAGLGGVKFTKEQLKNAKDATAMVVDNLIKKHEGNVLGDYGL